MAMVKENFLQGFIFDNDKMRKEYPDMDPWRCIHAILGLLPREPYKFVSAGNVDGQLTSVIVLNVGDDEEYLRHTLKIPDDDSFRQAVHYFMKPGVWPTHDYRQWLLAHFGGAGSALDTATTLGETQNVERLGDNSLWEGELDFVDGMLINDIRNNSAWHHRFFVAWACGIREGEEDRAHVFKRELTYVKQSISLVPNNPAAWNYLRGILQHNARPFSTVKDFIWPYTIPSSSSMSLENRSHTENRNIVDLENPPPAEGAELPVPNAIEFMADIWEKEGTKEGLDKACQFWKSLAIQHDRVRKKYWEYRIREARATIKADS